MVVAEQRPNGNLAMESELKSILNLCYQCSSCTSVCPLRRVSKFNPRKIIHTYKMNDQINEEDLTACLTCGLCLEICPQEVDFPDFIRQSRANLVINEEKYAHHNIFNLMQLFMSEMTETGMKFDYQGETDPDAKIAYFPGCIDLFDKFLDLEDTNFHQIGQSAINVINKAGVKPNLISLKCCGHDAYWTGDEGTFEQVRDYNTQFLKEEGVKTLVVSCAECYYTFGDLYDLKGITVQHISQFIDKHQDKLVMKGEKYELAYHDACRLGRFMKEYEIPRKVLEATGATIKEFSLNKQFTKCCGVSAWLRCDDASRAVMLRKLEEAALAVGNDGTLAVGCTKCYAHLNCVLEDRKPQHNFEIKVKEIGMIVDEKTS